MEEEEDKDLELRSEEVKEIMGSPPSWIIRWGSTVAFLVVGVLLFFAWFIEYPDTRIASIELTTAVPPAAITSTFDGNLESILVKSGEAVKEGDLLAVLQSTGKFEDILYLRDDLIELQNMEEVEILSYNLDHNYDLGEISPDYTKLVENFQSYNRTTSSDYEEESVNKLQQEKRQIRESIGISESALRSLKAQLKNERSDQDRLKKLFMDGTVSLLELEKANTRVERVRVDIQNIRSKISGKRQELPRIDQKIIVLRDKKQKTSSFDYTRFTQQIVRLVSAIDKWDEKYLLRAPIDGTISFPDEMNENQYIERGKPILNILPDQGGGWVCVGKLPIAGSAKVEEGQHVIIKFENYPYAEFGSVFGQVSDIALMPTGNTYHLEVSLNDGLNTTKKETLNYNQGMTGTAEIVVEEMRLLEILFEKLVSKVRR